MLNPFDNSSIVASYETWYDTIGQRADRLEKALLKELRIRFPKAETILDVGCGTGHFTRWFETLELKAIGVDISQAMLTEARRHCSEKVLAGDAHLLPFPAQSFDLVALITTLEFVQHPMVALHEAQRVAQQGILMGVLNRISWIGRQYVRKGGIPWEFARFFTPGELIEMVKQTCGEDSVMCWKTTLWRWFPWALTLPWGGFIGIGVQMY